MLVPAKVSLSGSIEFLWKNEMKSAKKQWIIRNGDYLESKGTEFMVVVFERLKRHWQLSLDEAWSEAVRPTRCGCSLKDIARNGNFQIGTQLME